MLLLRVQHLEFLTDCLDFISTITERSQIKTFIEFDSAVQHSLVTQANSAANSLVQGMRWYWLSPLILCLRIIFTATPTFFQRLNQCHLQFAVAI
ncbi:hypothetical protein NSTC745_02856 [Nostoc sp. DSM 114161]|jgi:hypothetical protein|uniref:hypothetical protein n=1 Tax=Nostoc sp. DSM 114161 TaxID=3440143 RepID=UPI0040455C2A